MIISQSHVRLESGAIAGTLEHWHTQWPDMGLMTSGAWQGKLA
jgi:hypothetical protein